jgi:hypothetical protein
VVVLAVLAFVVKHFVEERFLLSARTKHGRLALG